MQQPKKITIVLSAILFLSACAPVSPAVSSSSSEGKSPSSDTSSLEVSSVSSESSSANREKHSGVFKFYCVNDFHGSVLPGYDGYGRFESGIKKYFGKLKELKDADPEHTIVLSAGDMYQGSLESNLNYGNLVTEAMNAVPFDAMAIGNHEWDYGQQRLKDNIALADFPMLGGNVVKYENGAATTTPWYDGLGKSTIIEKAGVKIGIVGMIGYGQTTSIMSKAVEDVSFVNPEPIALAEAQRLKQEEGCEITMLVIHDDADQVLGWDAYRQLNAYFDGVFCGHSHTRNKKISDGVPLIQSYCNGRAFSHIEITLTEGRAKASNYNIQTASESWEDNSAIAAVTDKYLGKEDYTSRANATAGNLTEAIDNKGVARLGARAIYEKYHAIYPDLACAIENKQRATLPAGPVKYTQLYKCTPFTNNVIIMKALGSEIKSEGGYNNNVAYVGDLSKYGSLDDDKTYTIAVIDYLAYHQDAEKRYNYFPGLGTGEDTIIEEYDDYPMDISFAYLETLGNTIDASLFSESDPHFTAYAK